MSRGKRIWRVIELVEWTTGYFKRHGIDTARLDAELLLAHAMECSRLDLYLNFDAPVSREHLDIYRDLIVKRAQRMPVAYLIGVKEFMGIPLKVDRRALIPRPETELLVEEIVRRLKDRKPGEILDVGTGCGAIAISLAKLLPGWRVVAIDVSEGAIELARQNAETIGVNVELRVGDMFEPVGGMRFDCIVSNPPYIPSNQIPNLQPEIGYEPREALDGGPDGLEVIRRLISTSKYHIRPGGSIGIEVGFDQAEQVAELMEEAGYIGVEIIRDYSGIERVLIAKAPANT
ncbi:TPA: peptide chain release factor N(5)-glutamine methyltransferase [Candidatus Poribacteria bacterium]|nr:peptide chain release factor N(5)-glutamine methyltransferase [Candidatus Poribacteria bacterium]